MRIFVKAFNRTYYLARLLGTMRSLVSGGGKVTVLDDGTPRRYLDRLASEFPEVEVVQSPHGELKTRLMFEGRYDEQLSSAEQAMLGLVNPAEFWVDEIGRASGERILVLEEDVWFTGPLDLAALEPELSRHDVLMYRFFWNRIDGSVPSEETWKVVRAGRSELHLYKARLKKSLDQGKVIMPAQGIYSKDYWLHAFSAPDYRFRTRSQFERAMEFLRARGAGTFAHSGSELVRHGYSSSSRRLSFSGGLAHDPLPFNMALNDAWCEGVLDASASLPMDFDDDVLERALRGRIPEVGIDAWRQWKSAFLGYYRGMGAAI